MKKKLGLIQTGGLGDIHIALPIALFYHKKNFEIYWPIIENWVTQMKHYVPWINWIGISRENKDQAYNEPVKILDSVGVEKKIPLYNFLRSKPELSNTPYFPFVPFDKFKYIKADVPFFYKWKLNECIKRDTHREDEIFNKFVKNKNFVVTHIKASNHTAAFDLSLIPKDFQVVEITNDGYVLDWLKVIEKAKMLFMTNSVMANITEQLNFENTKYYIPRLNMITNPVFINDWIWIKNENLKIKI